MREFPSRPQSDAHPNSRSDAGARPGPHTQSHTQSHPEAHAYAVALHAGPL